MINLLLFKTNCPDPGWLDYVGYTEYLNKR